MAGGRAVSLRHISLGVYWLIVIIALLALTVTTTEALPLGRVKKAWNMLKVFFG